LLHRYKNDQIRPKDLTYPRVLGHEIVGEVIENRSTNPRIKKGDVVQVYPGISCGECSWCRRGDENLCKSIKVIGFNHDGGFSSYFTSGAAHSRKYYLNKVDRRLPLYCYTFTEPVASCVSACEKIRIHSTDKSLVIGGGLMGILQALTVRSCGVKEIFLIDLLDRSEDLELNGVKKITVGNESEEINTIKDIAPDIVFIATSAFAFNNRLIECMAGGGRILLFSGLPEDKKISFIDWNRVHYKEITVNGCYGSTARHNHKAVEMLKNGDIDTSPMVGKLYPLKDYSRAFQEVEGNKYLKLIFEI
jgi:L-iditol 2-dehydrogenase